MEIVYYAFHGIRANSNRHDAILRNLPYLGIACVGIGSAVFHSTMMNYTQWCQLLLNSPRCLVERSEERGLFTGRERDLSLLLSLFDHVHGIGDQGVSAVPNCGGEGKIGSFTCARSL